MPFRCQKLGSESAPRTSAESPDSGGTPGDHEHPLLRKGRKANPAAALAAAAAAKPQQGPHDNSATAPSDITAPAPHTASGRHFLARLTGCQQGTSSCWRSSDWVHWACDSLPAGFSWASWCAGSVGVRGTSPQRQQPPVTHTPLQQARKGSRSRAPCSRLFWTGGCCGSDCCAKAYWQRNATRCTQPLPAKR